LDARKNKKTSRHSLLISLGEAGATALTSERKGKDERARELEKEERKRRRLH